MKVKGKYKILFATLVTAIVLLSIFAAMIQTGMIELEVSPKEIVEGRPLFSKIFVDETSGTTPFSVNFTSLVLYHVGDVSYKWDFGDGNTSDEINPAYTYVENGTFRCNLTVTDSTGRKSLNSVEIKASANQAPTGQIFTDLRPSRPYIPLMIGITSRLEFIYRQLLRAGYIPESLLSRRNFIFCRAEASDAEGDEIVSYEWELKPPMYTTLTGQQVKPVYKFKGKEITIPLIYVYTSYTYDLTLIVTDSKGNKGTTTEKLEVKISQPETFYYTMRGYKENFRRNVWLLVLKDAFGEDVGNLIYENIFPILPNLPVLKFLAVRQLFRNWGMRPDPTLKSKIIIQFLERHRALKNIVREILERIISFLEKRNPDSPFIDRIEKRLEDLGFENKRPVISDPFPRNGDKNIPRNCPYVSINITDFEGDRFNVTISGDYVNDKFYDYVTNATFNATLKTPLPPVTDIKWHVEVVDQNGKVVLADFEFTTFSI